MDSSPRPSRLTPLQRDLLDAFFAREQRLFLTGGGALAGFYLGHRTTEDLDLFTLPGLDLADAAHALDEAARSARLHDQLVPLAAACSGDGSTEKLLAGSGQPPNETIAKRLRDNAEGLFRAPWPHLTAEADALGAEARLGLAERARREADELRTLLDRQRGAIDKAEARLRQADLFNIQDKEQKRQVDRDLAHLARRRDKAAEELVKEPLAIEALYDVRMSRLSPVGLVVAWPESMT